MRADPCPPAGRAILRLRLRAPWALPRRPARDPTPRAFQVTPVPGAIPLSDRAWRRARDTWQLVPPRSCYQGVGNSKAIYEDITHIFSPSPWAGR